jgi:hypothetical protein
MKKIYSLFLSMFALSAAVHANPGDTTVVQANISQLSNYGNYDTTVAFPNGSVTYRKVIMEFTLGKYACPGYNPNDPGETSQGHTGWCSDWDYDVHMIAMVPNGDTMELGRMITPYANSNYPRTPAAWSHPYVFDVTDFYPLLKNNVGMRIFYSGYSGGFTGNVKFYFIEGTPARNVIKIDNLWQGGYSYGNTTDPIETHIAPKSITMPASAVSAEMKVIITGHGGDNTANCAEFCKKWYQVAINGTVTEQKDIWRDDCGSNFLFPQSGTWVYDRGNWCPGDLVHDNIHKMPATVTPGSTFTADLNFQTYTSGNNGASYKVAAGMFYYGAYNHATDAGLDAIISPSNLEANYRSNPVCGQPVVTVKNYGSNDITSIQFTYGVVGQTMSTYTWTGSMSSNNSADITLPSIPAMNTVSGAANQFTVTLSQVNGAADQDTYNNTLKSTFTAAPKWQTGHFRADFKMTSAIQGSVNKTNWTIKDMDGNTILSRQGTASIADYKDTFNLANGCYRLDVDGSYLGYGLSFLGSFTPGYFKIYDLVTGTQIALPKNDLDNANLAGNFGNGFTQYFTVENSSVVGVNNVNNPNITLLVYPNPAKNYVHLEIMGHVTENAHVELVNILGQVVYASDTKDLNINISTQNIANGMYTLSYSNAAGRRTQKVIVSK